MQLPPSFAASLVACLAVAGCAAAPPRPKTLVPMPSGTAAVRLDVRNVRSTRGTVYCSLHREAKFFPGASPFQGGQLNRVAASAVACDYEGLAPGDYAVSVFHDENGNGELDTSWVGAPTEGYGASQNALPGLSAPEFAPNHFALAAGEHKQLTVTLRYR